MSALKQSTNIAAGMGRWSARHRTTAIFGWLACVITSFVIGGTVGMKEMSIGLAAAILIDATIVRRRAPARGDEAARRVELGPADAARCGHSLSARPWFRTLRPGPFRSTMQGRRSSSAGRALDL